MRVWATIVPQGAGSLAAVVRSADAVIGAAPLAFRLLRVGPRQHCRIAVVGMVAPERGRDHVADEQELIYRALLDLLTSGAEPAHIVSFAVPADAEERVDELWRLGIALRARCMVRERKDDLVVDVILPGVRGELGAIVRELTDGDLWARFRSRLRGMAPRGARPPLDGNASLFSLDLSGASRAVAPGEEVEFVEVPARELARRPGKYGLSLVAARGASGAARCYAALVGGEVVFRMYASDVPEDTASGPYAAGLARLPRPAAMIFSALTVPEHRGRSIYPAALAWVAERHRRSGYRALCLTAQLENRAAVRAAEKAGFRRVD